MKEFDVYGSLTAIKKLHTNKRGEYLWEFRCVCGKLHIAAGTVIKRQAKIIANSAVPSCGCVNREVAAELSTKHGYAYHPLYTVYKGMRRRCYNKKSSSYHLYGGVGVTVCDEWLGDPAKFISWGICNGWSPGLQLDKDILCDQLSIHPKVYSPDTCQFVSSEKNSNYASSRETARKDSKNIVVAPDVANTIRDTYAEGALSQRDLALQFGVSQNTICRIIHTDNDSIGV